MADAMWHMYVEANTRRHVPAAVNAGWLLFSGVIPRALICPAPQPTPTIITCLLPLSHHVIVGTDSSFLLPIRSKRISILPAILPALTALSRD